MAHRLVVIFLCRLIFILKDLHCVKTNFAFESCTDGFTPHGGCTTLKKSGAIGDQSTNTVLVNNGYLDAGSKSGCPFVASACQSGYQYYGWIRFHSYPSSCSSYGVLVNTGVFNLLVLGTGRIGAYAWMPNDLEWYAETSQPVLLNIFYPMIVQFNYTSKTQTGSLRIVMQNQMSAEQNCSRPRTMTPASKNLVFGGDGAGGHYANVEYDRTSIDSPAKDIQTLAAFLVDTTARKKNCEGKNLATLTRPYSCFWVENAPRAWTAAYDSCNASSYTAGYPYGRLARFDSPDSASWNLVSKKIASVGVSQIWLGGGKQGQWLNRSMTSVGTVKAPPGVALNSSQEAGRCMMLNTATNPWQWAEASCDTPKKYLCEMSWDCLIENPCKNLGGCMPITDGPRCQCFSGTSGTNCETGTLQPTCINDCPCSAPPVYACDSSSTASAIATTSPASKTSAVAKADNVAITIKVSSTPAAKTVATSVVTRSMSKVIETSGVTPSISEVIETSGVTKSISTIIETSGVTQSMSKVIATSGVTPSISEVVETSGVTQSISEVTETSSVTEPSEAAPQLPPTSNDPEFATCFERYKIVTMEQTTVLTSIEEFMTAESIEYDYVWETEWKSEFRQKWKNQRRQPRVRGREPRQADLGGSEKVAHVSSNCAYRLLLKSRFNDVMIQSRRHSVESSGKTLSQQILAQIEEIESRKTWITQGNCYSMMQSTFDSNSEIKTYWQSFFSEMSEEAQSVEESCQ